MTCQREVPTPPQSRSSSYAAVCVRERERFPFKEIGNLAVHLQDDSKISRTLSMELSLAARCHKRPKTNGYLPNLSVLLKYVSLHPYSPSPVQRPTFFLRARRKSTARVYEYQPISLISLLSFVCTQLYPFKTCIFSV